MNLDKVKIVLSRPENSQNVGAVCRAMATSGIHCLRIVGNRQDYDDIKVRALAIHAYDIWDNAEFFSTITAASADCALSAGTTRRRGKKRGAFLMLPEEFAIKTSEVTGALNSSNDALNKDDANASCAAVVFGNERTGLTDDEMNECTLGVTIPSAPDFASLNLSHAVQVVCYCLFREAQKESRCGGMCGWSAIPLKRLDEVTKTIADALKAAGFFSVSGEEGMESTIRFWRGVLSRSALSEGEAKYMEHIFNKAKGMISKKGS